ncbi:MAG: phage tail protein [bacterium]
MPSGGRTDPYRNFNFRVEIDGVTQSMFSEVILPEARADVIEYREGGEPSIVRKLPGRIHFGNLILKWGTTTSHELYDWWRTVQDGHAVRKSLSVILLDESQNEVKRWNFRHAWPMRYQPPVLNAQGTEVVIELLEIAHEGMELA